ncbi:MAG: hypothetical protein ABIG37_02490 [Nanoarchaeota archaeon]
MNEREGRIVDYKHSSSERIPIFKRWGERTELDSGGVEKLLSDFEDWKFVRFRKKGDSEIYTFYDMPKKGSLVDLKFGKFSKHYVHIRIQPKGFNR